MALIGGCDGEGESCKALTVVFSTSITSAQLIALGFQDFFFSTDWLLWLGFGTIYRLRLDGGLLDDTRSLSGSVCGADDRNFSVRCIVYEIEMFG